MRILICAAIVAFCFSLTAPVCVVAAQKKGEVVMKMGSRVHLFHGGKVEANKEVSVGEILPVYHQNAHSGQMKKVGEIKVVRFVGEHYFEAEIIKGNVKMGDIAKSGKGGYLIQEPD